MYKQYLKLNRNIFIAFAVDFIVSAIVAQMLIEQEHYLNATVTILADHVTFLSILGFLLYLDNRNKYRLNSGKTNWSLLKTDLVKIIATLGIAEIIYTIVRWGFQFYFLTVDYEPYLASILGQIIAVAIYLVIINFLVKITRWYKDDT
ncbi:MAG: hypothetical protein EX274_00300 [Marine Group I thaumarchaeote]|nr:hypothetical protein [Marine Group I thaumarchaeote]